MAVTGSCLARPFRHVSWRVRSVTLDQHLAAASTVIPLPSPSEFGPSTSVRLGWCAPRTSSAAQDRGVETSHMRLKTCTTPGWRFGTSHPRKRAPSAPRPGLARRGRGLSQLRDGRGHPDHSFLLCMWIARGRPNRALRFAPASTNTASTAGPRTLRICACDRTFCPRAG